MKILFKTVMQDFQNRTAIIVRDYNSSEYNRETGDINFYFARKMSHAQARESAWIMCKILFESLILAQDKRWRRA